MNSPNEPERIVNKQSAKALFDRMRAAVEAEVAQLQPESDESQAIPELEIRTLQRDKLSLENEQLREGIEDRRADRALRKRYADYAFRFLIFFSLFCALILYFQGDPAVPFKLGENIVVTLIGATAASVIGLVGFVARGLFKAPD